MNGKVYLKGIPYFSDSQVVELTQAEYDALPNSKNSDGILYCIKDGGLNVNNRFSPVIYSNDEREIGVWTDGKPLYQCTVTFTVDNTSGYKRVTTGIANAETVLIDFSASYYLGGGLAKIPCVAYLGSEVSTSYLGNALGLLGTVVDNYLCIDYRAGQNVWGASAVVTVRYTKTTDTAGNNTWGTDGTPMYHYSTSERIVGTFTDGKTIYEKTYHLTAPTTLNYNIPVQDISELHIDKVISLDGYYYGNSRSNINLSLGEENASSCWVNTNYEIAMRITNSARVGQAFFVTLRYTKTT